MNKLNLLPLVVAMSCGANVGHSVNNRSCEERGLDSLMAVLSPRDGYDTLKDALANKNIYALRECSHDKRVWCFFLRQCLLESLQDAILDGEFLPREGESEVEHLENEFAFFMESIASRLWSYEDTEKILCRYESLGAEFVLQTLLEEQRFGFWGCLHYFKSLQLLINPEVYLKWAKVFVELFLSGMIKVNGCDSNAVGDVYGDMISRVLSDDNALDDVFRNMIFVAKFIAESRPNLEAEIWKWIRALRDNYPDKIPSDEFILQKPNIHELPIGYSSFRVTTYNRFREYLQGLPC